ncbi:MAG: mono/diheme cytochrome c family protein [Cognaticolwellia sp.]|jgi:mono/diheme cytochrome c family protein
MRTLLMSLAVATSLVACSGGEEPAPAPEAKPAAETKPEPKPEPKEVVAAFDAKAEFAKTCAACHGTSGLGDGVAAAALDPKPASFADASFWETRTTEGLHSVIKIGGAANGKSPLMAPYGGMYDDEQISQLVGYISDTWKPKS